MNNVLPMNRLTVKRRKRAEARNYIAPADLHSVLEPTHTQVITFKTEKDMRSYRQMLYTVNKQGEYRYRTLRDEHSMWGIVVWRMH